MMMTTWRRKRATVEWSGLAPARTPPVTSEWSDGEAVVVLAFDMESYEPLGQSIS